MTIRISNAAAVVGLDNILDLADAGPAAAHLKIYSGAAPTNVEDAPTGTLLADLTMSDPAFLGATDQNPDAQAAADAITDDASADGTGTAGYFRLEDSNGLQFLQGSVGTSGQDLNLNSTSISTGQNVAVTSLTFTLPEVGP